MEVMADVQSSNNEDGFMGGTCEHPDNDVSYSEVGDYTESKIAHCSACGHEWFVSHREWRELTSFDEGGNPRRRD